MSTPIDDGGPAFPCPAGHIECFHPQGMSLRQYYAAAAVKGMLSGNPTIVATNFQEVVQLIAKGAFLMADAMIAAGKEKE